MKGWNGKSPLKQSLGRGPVSKWIMHFSRPSAAAVLSWVQFNHGPPSPPARRIPRTAGLHAKTQTILRQQRSPGPCFSSPSLRSHVLFSHKPLHCSTHKSYRVVCSWLRGRLRSHLGRVNEEHVWVSADCFLSSLRCSWVTAGMPPVTGSGVNLICSVPVILSLIPDGYERTDAALENSVGALDKH